MNKNLRFVVALTIVAGVFALAGCTKTETAAPTTTAVNTNPVFTAPISGDDDYGQIQAAWDSFWPAWYVLFAAPSASPDVSSIQSIVSEKYLNQTKANLLQMTNTGAAHLPVDGKTYELDGDVEIVVNGDTATASQCFVEYAETFSADRSYTITTPGVGSYLRTGSFVKENGVWLLDGVEETTC